MKSVWGVYTQYEPTHKYEESLESVWSTKDKALEEANSIEMTKHNDWVMVREIQLDKRYQNYEELEDITVKSPRSRLKKCDFCTTPCGNAHCPTRRDG